MITQRSHVTYQKSSLFPSSVPLSLPFCFLEKGIEKEDGNLTENGFRMEAQSTSALIFLGTGCSSAVPNAMCLIQPTDPPCKVCSQALSVPPERNPYYRSVDFF